MPIRPKKPRPRRHYRVLVSPRQSLYACPACGVLGDLATAIEHAVAHQFVVVEEHHG